MINKDISNLDLKHYIEKNSFIFNLIDDFILKYEIYLQFVENKNTVIDNDLKKLQKDLKQLVNIVDCKYINNEVIISIADRKVKENSKFYQFELEQLPKIKIRIKEIKKNNSTINLMVDYSIFSPQIKINNHETTFNFFGYTFGFVSYKNHKAIYLEDQINSVNTFNHPEDDKEKKTKLNITINYEKEKIYINSIVSESKINKTELLDFTKFLNMNFQNFSHYLYSKENKKSLNECFELLKLTEDFNNPLISEFLNENDYSGVRLLQNDYLNFKKSKFNFLSKIFKR